jgi:hypothetical protein
LIGAGMTPEHRARHVMPVGSVTEPHAEANPFRTPCLGVPAQRCWRFEVGLLSQVRTGFPTPHRGGGSKIQSGMTPGLQRCGSSRLASDPRDSMPQSVRSAPDAASSAAATASNSARAPVLVTCPCPTATSGTRNANDYEPCTEPTMTNPIATSPSWGEVGRQGNGIVVRT